MGAYHQSFFKRIAAGPGFPARRTNDSICRRTVFFILTVTCLVFSGRVLAEDFYRVKPSGSKINFAVRQWGIPLVNGAFERFKGEVAAKDGRLNYFSGTVYTSSINTRNKYRDRDLTAEGFFASGRFPEMKILARKITQEGEAVTVDGDLTIRDVTKTVVLKGFVRREENAQGKRISLALAGDINRRDFGLLFNPLLEFLVNDRIKISLNLKAFAAAQ